MLRSIGVFAFVTVFFVGAFNFSRNSDLSHAQASEVALTFGFLSALAWGQSVSGLLLWRNLGLLDRPEWNGWFNFFAAALAALALGYQSI